MDEASGLVSLATSIGDKVRASLSEQPRRLSHVVDVLLAADAPPDGILREFRTDDSQGRAHDLDREALEESVLDLLLDRDDVWLTAHGDPWLAAADELADAMSFTHRLTERDLSCGEIPIVPDLVAVDHRARGSLSIPGVGRLNILPGPERRPGHDDSVITGPDGWLAGFSPGDLVAFCRHGNEVGLVRVDEPPPDDDVVALLSESAALRIKEGHGEEAFPLVLDAMTVGRDAFRHPGRPLGELLADAGLERRGFTWGPQGETWSDAAETARLLSRSLTARTYGFQRCCLDARDRMMEVVDDRSGHAVQDRFGRNLHHGHVAPAAFDEITRFPDDGIENADPDAARDASPSTAGRYHRLLALASKVAAGSRPYNAAGRYVLALAAERRGEAIVAEELVHRALVDDPDYAPANAALLRNEIDRSHIDAAVRLLDEAGESLPPPTADYLRNIHTDISLPFVKAGRNQACPCGSGRKFKACCIDGPKLTPRQRAALIDLKLSVFIRDAYDEDVLTTSLAMAGDDAEEFGNPLFNPLAPDLLAFEGGLARRYLDRRHELLSEHELEILHTALGEPRRCWEIVGVGPGPSIDLCCTDTGRTATTYDPIAAADREAVGVTVLWRIVRVDAIDYPLGFQIKVPSSERAHLRKILASDPSVLELAAWYRDLTV